MAWASHIELGEINDFLIKSLPAAVVDAFGNPFSPINPVERCYLEVSPRGTSGRFDKNPIHLKLYDYTDAQGEITDLTKGPGIRFTLKSKGNQPVELDKIPTAVKTIEKILGLCTGEVAFGKTTIPNRILVEDHKPNRITLKGFNPNEALIFTLDTSPNSKTVHGIVELIRQSLDA